MRLSRVEMGGMMVKSGHQFTPFTFPEGQKDPHSVLFTSQSVVCWRCDDTRSCIPNWHNRWKSENL